MGSDNKQDTLEVEPPTPSGGTAPRWEPGSTAPESHLLPLAIVVLTCVAFQAFGLLIAFVIFKNGATASYSEKIAAAVYAEHAAMYMALVVVAFAIRVVNIFPMAFKEKVMKGVCAAELKQPMARAGRSHSTLFYTRCVRAATRCAQALRNEIGANMRSNPFIFKVVGPSKETVLFDNEGVVGKYNRANRSLTHMIENFGSVLAALMLAGTIFPFPTLVCACLFAVGRVMHQVSVARLWSARARVRVRVPPLTCVCMCPCRSATRPPTASMAPDLRSAPWASSRWRASASSWPSPVKG